MTDQRFTTSIWPGSPSAEDSVGRALVLPGGGYTVDHPLLYWGCTVLTQNGWRVVTMRWQWDASPDSGERRAFVEEGARHLDTAAGPAPKTLILAKSLGCYAAEWASRRSYPAVWLTPVLVDDLVSEALKQYSAPALLVGGTSDPAWDHDRATANDLPFIEMPGANHSLQLESDWQGSIAILEETMTAIAHFADGIAN